MRFAEWRRAGAVATAATLLLVLLPTPASAVTTLAALQADLCAGGGAVALTGNISQPSNVLTVTANCTATLDLNGKELTLQRVVLGADSELTIRDSGGGGELIADATGASNEAGIRTTGATLRIESGTVTANGGADAAGIGGGDTDAGGTAEVSGGTVRATGGFRGAGIGGGRQGAGGTLTFSGGTIEATGGNQAAGIGGGSQGAGGTLTFSGGTVTATGGFQGAGIGGGRQGAGGTLTFSGGTIEATGGDQAAGIGGGYQGGGEVVTISGGEVVAIGGGPFGTLGGAAGIGGGYDGGGGTITILGGATTATAGSADAAPIGPGANRSEGSVVVDPSAIDSIVGLVRSISFPAPPAPPVPSLRVVCGAEGVSVGATVVCMVSGGDPGIDILWRAAYNPVIAEAGVTLDASGSGEFSFVVPAAALGEELTVELVEWLAPVSLGVAGGPVPAAVPAGEGPMPVWPSLFAALFAVGLLRRGMRKEA